MKSTNQISIAGDYAVASFKDHKFPDFYFGYEVTQGGSEADGEWCFQARFSESDIITIPQSELGLEDGLEMGNYLLAGIAILIERGILKRA